MENDEHSYSYGDGKALFFPIVEHSRMNKIRPRSYDLEGKEEWGRRRTEESERWWWVRRSQRLTLRGLRRIIIDSQERIMMRMRQFQAITREM